MMGVCSNASRLQNNANETRICVIKGSGDSTCFCDHAAQSRVNQVVSCFSKRAIFEILAEVEGRKLTSYRLSQGQCGVSCGPAGGGIMCSRNPPACGLLPDKLSLLWGDYKGNVEELTMEGTYNDATGCLLYTSDAADE